MLNKSKGPAVWSPRSQNDREGYAREARRRVLSEPNLTVVADTIGDLSVEDGEISGISTGCGDIIGCRSLVLCSGTFLNAVMHTGENTVIGGRFGEPASIGLTEKFRRLGFSSGRLKTGTPPRLALHTIELRETEEQLPDTEPAPFSFQNKRISNPQIPMYLTYTNPLTHAILRSGFDRSPLFTGRIKGIGPRYCPSIEDKVNRFADKDRHQIFLEPEGYDSEIAYMNGFSSSLPEDVQRSAIATIPGLKRAVILRAGYAVEYDFFPPNQISHTLETKQVRGLFFAGQINGTSGYEEAAAQGLMAGINAALRVKGEDPFALRRSDAYIGVLIDDLITKSTEEPYRMFTSRAEYRLQLRQDNADTRLMRHGHRLGLIPDRAIVRLDEKEHHVAHAKSLLRTIRVLPEEVNGLILARAGETLKESENLYQLLKRPEVDLAEILELPTLASDERLMVLRIDREARDRLQIEIKFEGYLKRQEEQIRLFEKNEEIQIPHDFDFFAVRSLSSEAKEKLQRIRPRSIGQASRISGVTVADISVLMVAMLH